MARHDPGWEQSKLLARAILHDRAARRKWIGGMLVVPLAMMVLGLWGIDEWLGESVVRFLAWWSVCGVATLVVMGFAVYDALAVVGEEREKWK